TQRSTWKTIAGMLGFGGVEKKSANSAKELPLTATVAPASSGEDLAEAKKLAPLVASLQAGLSVEPVRASPAGSYKKTRLINIKYQHGDPETAAKLTNCIAETFVRSNLEKKNETNTSTSEFLSKRVAELQSTIHTDEEKLVNYAKNNQILSLDTNQNTVV